MTAVEPLVSVLMPAYNAEDTIGAAISSVLQQTHRRFELIVVDDGSTDGTHDICAAFGDRITLVRTPNRGTSHARNVAFAHSSGDFIAFCDSDDQLLPPALAWGLDRLRSAGPRVVVTQEALVMTEAGLAHGRRLIRSTFPTEQQRMAVLERNFVGIFSMFPRELLDEVGGFDEQLRMLEDWDLWLRAIYAGWCFVFQPRPVAIYRLSAGSLSVRQDRFEVERGVFARFNEAHGHELEEHERAFLLDRLTHSPGEAAEAAVSASRAHRWRESRAHYRRLSTLSPTRRDVRWKARVVSRVPLIAQVLQLRQSRLDARIGQRVGGAS